MNKLSFATRFLIHDKVSSEFSVLAKETEFLEFRTEFLEFAKKVNEYYNSLDKTNITAYHIIAGFISGYPECCIYQFAVDSTSIIEEEMIGIGQIPGRATGKLNVKNWYVKCFDCSGDNYNAT